ncbi:MAG: hypothetical protein JST39_13000 [Bacteroidetes bacterium]|nr:hypothetical protein [Bacteroidota bacterium]
MKLIRVATIAISGAFVGLFTIMLFIAFLHDNEADNYYFMSPSPMVVLDLFYLMFLVIPYHYRESRYINAINWGAFILSIVPIVLVVLLLIAMSGTEC